MTITLTKMQDEAVLRVLDWLVKRDKPVFKLFGYAGTGKTTIAKQIAKAAARQSEMDHPVKFAAYTGKAASVLRRKGCDGATTIHQLIYKPMDRRCDHCGFIMADNVRHVPEKPGRCRSEVGESVVEFALRHNGLNANTARLVIIDECSMVGRKVGEDLLSFGIPILVLGDPAQLPPVGDGGFFTEGEPDVLLTEIHRQEEGCGVLDIATAVRTGRRLVVGDYSESAVRHLSAISTIDAFGFDQVICGTNKSRAWWNARMRQALGRTSPLPEPMDKLICTQNNHDLKLMNGEMVIVHEVSKVTEWNLRLGFVREGASPGNVEYCDCDRHYFDGKPGKPDYAGDGTAVFDFGYAITCHKSQGSQWGRVLVHNESRTFRDDAARWLYTAVTRAEDHVTVLGA